MGRVGRRWGGLAPGLGASPGAGCGEVEVDGLGGGGFLWLSGAGAGWGWFEERTQAVAELWDGVAEGEEAGGEDGAGEVKGVAGGVDVAFEDCGLLAAEGQRDGGEVEAAGDGRGWNLAGAARRVGGGRSRLEQEIAQRNRSMVQWINLQGLVGELQFAGEDGPLYL